MCETSSSSQELPRYFFVSKRSNKFPNFPSNTFRRHVYRFCTKKARENWSFRVFITTARDVRLTQRDYLSFLAFDSRGMTEWVPFAPIEVLCSESNDNFINSSTFLGGDLFWNPKFPNTIWIFVLPVRPSLGVPFIKIHRASQKTKLAFQMWSLAHERPLCTTRFVASLKPGMRFGANLKSARLTARLSYDNYICPFAFYKLMQKRSLPHPRAWQVVATGKTWYIAHELDRDDNAASLLSAWSQLNWKWNALCTERSMPSSV